MAWGRSDALTEEEEEEEEEDDDDSMIGLISFPSEASKPEGRRNRIRRLRLPALLLLLLLSLLLLCPTEPQLLTVYVEEKNDYSLWSFTGRCLQIANSPIICPALHSMGSFSCRRRDQDPVRGTNARRRDHLFKKQRMT